MTMKAFRLVSAIRIYQKSSNNCMDLDHPPLMDTHGVYLCILHNELLSQE